MKLLKLTSRSATFELVSNNPYYHDCKFDIYLNDELLRVEDRNVFSVFDLTPNTNYTIKVLKNVIEFQTLEETVCLNVRDFNVYADGINDDTAKIQSAIMCACENATVYIPKGIYLVSSLYLKSNMMLYLEKGAKLLARSQRDAWAVHPGLIGDYNIGVWEGSMVNNFASVINGIDIKNTIICGEGTVDSQAQNGDWYINHRQMNIAWRGHSLFFNRCDNIDVIGIHVTNTQSWAIHPFFSNNLSFINISIKNPPEMPTTDGIDPDCCDHVDIIGCVFDVGDDCIAIKSGTYDLALKYRKPCSNLFISNNYMLQGHGGVVFGSESSGGIKNVIVEKCLFENTDRGLRIKTRRGRGNIGSIDNVSFNNIMMNKVKTPFVINMYYNMGPAGGHEEYVWTTKKLPVDDRTPVIGNFKFSNMVCNNVEFAAGVFLGLPESKIGILEFENIKFNYNNNCEEGFPVMIEHNFKMKNVGLYCFNVENVITKNIEFIGNLGENIIVERSDE